MMRYNLLMVLLSGLSLLAAQTETDARLHLAKYASDHQLPLVEFSLSSTNRESKTGITHFYFRQTEQGYPVRGGHASVHFAADGVLLHITHKVRASETPATTVSLDITEATARERVKSIYPGSKVRYSEGIEWVADESGRLILCRMVSGQSEQGDHFVVAIDAKSGAILDNHSRALYCHGTDFAAYEHGLISEALPRSPAPKVTEETVFSGQYNVFALPSESPLTSVRQLQTANQLVDPIASPFGWHDTDGNAATSEFVYTKGNNTYAYYATPPVSNPPAIPILREPGTNNYLSGNVPWPAGNTLNFNYNNNIDQAVGSTFIEDAVTNLFVTVNQAHDIFYRYGFDEAAGNFQTVNHSGVGTGNDAVLARAQDGGGVNQASFSTPPEGMPPSMRMHLWSTNQPNSARDGSFENSIIVHEYGHGVAARLVQGPFNVDCLFNFEQGGEGWSDFFGLMLTQVDYNGNGQIDRNVLGEGTRGLGHFALNQSTQESGLRPRHYTGNMDPLAGIHNEYTYADLPALGFPHGTGFLWGTILWDINLDFMDLFGFEPDLSNVSANAGNVRAMQLVVEGLKMTPCNPTFVDMRDAILAADIALYGGIHHSLLWKVFARRGLGVSASPGGNAAFDRPELRVLVNSSTPELNVGDQMNYNLTVANGSAGGLQAGPLVDFLDPGLAFISAPGGDHQNGVVTFNDLGIIPGGNAVERNITVQYQSTESTEVLIDLPVETNDLSNFVPAGSWIPVSDFPNPASGSTQSWFHPALGIPVESSLLFSLNLPAGTNNHLSFFHDFDLELGLDGGVLEILQGTEWVDLDSRILTNGYRYVIRDELITPVGIPVPFTTLSRRRAWSGSSNGYQRCVVDLSEFSGTNVTLRFRFASNNGNNVSNCDAQPGGCDGWFIDDIQLLDLVHVQNQACINQANPPVCGDDGRLGVIIWPGQVLPLVDLDLQLRSATEYFELSWNRASAPPDLKFRLQRSYDTEEGFRDLAFIDGRFRYQDHQVEKNRDYYYRLYAEDESEVAYYSRIVHGRLGELEELRIYPNPGKGVFTVTWSDVGLGQADLSVSSLTGNILAEQTIDVVAGRISADLSDYPAGTYLLRLQLPGGLSTRKIIVTE
ncbi:hypothetical protein CEQ90_13865 [Lewinellaceae bacterium SD302]|nr:hypothetical protein CEQ90_13865 [Lewinellaceae bacterium SD302]